MRRAFKKQAEDFMLLLGQAHQEIRIRSEKGSLQDTLELLEQCQQGAIQLGNLIEQSEGEDFVTIGLIEDYCELIYQIYEKMSRGADIDADEINKALEKQFVKISESVRDDIKIRLEVVFLPYQASMWDSLESVWKAADEDPDCDAYVIPIPYYDKNPDGSFRERHYEGNRYPEYVPITDYEKYDLAKRRPDAIFIHNPYDECNYVTSIHPFFYSKNLKQFTEQLVYIPYFILDERADTSKDQLYLRNIGHFCKTPGVFNADRVIVQSEIMRQTYINIMVDFLGRETRIYWENKILGLGSPKIEKILNADRKKMQMPDEWKKVILRPDGKWKKVILYNTSINALLSSGEKMIMKMREVFRFFKENQNGLALLWRPHPLLKATVASMRPDLWKKYEELTDEYKLEKFGIYDDSGDVSRAIALCDGYYGDQSSVTVLCQAADVPVMLQNVNIDIKKYNEIYQRPSAMNMAEENGKIWAALLNGKGICEIDIKNRRGKICKRFEADMFGKDFLYMNVMKINDYLIFSPGIAEKIAIYDLKKDALTYIPLEKYACKQSNLEPKFWNIVRYQSVAFLIGYSYPAIIKVDMDTKEAEYITDWVAEVEDNIEEGDQSGYFSDGYVISEKLLLLPIGCMKAVLELNLITLHTKVKKLNVPMKGIGGIASVDARHIWMVGKVEKTNYVSCWDRETDMIKEICLAGEDENTFVPFYAPLCTENKMYLLPIEASHIYEIDLETEEIVIKKEIPSSYEYSNSFWWRKTLAPRFRGASLLFLAGDDLKWHEYNLLTGKSRNYHVYLEEEVEDRERYFDVIFLHSRDQTGSIIVSETQIPFERFLDKLSEDNVYVNKYKDIIGCGKKIYDLACKKNDLSLECL